MMFLASSAADNVKQAVADGHVGALMTAQGGGPQQPGMPWAADNGCYTLGEDFDLDRYLAWLASKDPAGCLFATAPDVVGDAVATWERSAPVLPRIRALGYPAAFVAQDGIDQLEVDWSAFDVLFIGGTDSFKLGPVARALVGQAKAHGKWVHCGRVNSLKRMRYAQFIGCDSVDGTFISFGPDVNLPIVLGWARDVRTQTFLDLN